MLLKFSSSLVDDNMSLRHVVDFPFSSAVIQQFESWVSLLLLLMCDCGDRIYKLKRIPTSRCSKYQYLWSKWESERKRHDHAVNMEAVQQPRCSVAVSEKTEQTCLELCCREHHVSLSCQLHTYRCPSVAIPAPALYPGLPKCTLLLCSAWAAVVQSHIRLLFDLTLALRRLRQARPGISAMWLKNGNRRQEYKRRHTSCGCGSLAEEWVVD